MSSLSERPTMSSEITMLNINDNLKIDLINNNAASNPPKELINTDAFDKLFSLQKLIQKQAGLKDICKIK